ncbi:MAG: hypothetical protein J2P39_08970, partial [Candidatus Dormibacteraeota bacterium]|nr:hypothetical protein [Candidatus Dormibacteraeota bacterium]
MDRVLVRLRAALGDRAPDPLAILTLGDAVQALGHDGVDELGQRDVPLEQVVGTVSRAGDFDRRFRPRHGRERDRRERIARIAAGGVDLPPVDLVLLGELYFVRDGHHRVSVARALGRPTIVARVQRICTIAYGMACLRLAHLPVKAAERLFLERVPLPADVRTDLWLDDPAEWARLADAAEAWGFRTMLAGRPLRDRAEFATAWWTDEVVPVIARLRARGEAVGLR